MAKKTLTKQEWRDLENCINFYIQTRLKIDGRILSVYLVRIGMKLVYNVSVEGDFKYEWFMKESDVGYKYLFPIKRYNLDAKKVKDVCKILGKKEAEKRGFVRKLTTYGYSCFFKSFRTMKKVWEDNNESIEWLR